MSFYSTVRQPLMIVAFLGLVAVSGHVGWAQTASEVPTTLSDAKKLLDLEALPLFKGASAPIHRSVGKLSYEVQGSAEDVFEFHRKALLEMKWKEAEPPIAMVGLFTRDGLIVALSALSLKEGLVTVTLQHHGNVNLSKLPVPAGAKEFFSGPVNAVFMTQSSPAATSKALQKLLQDKGWKAYGSSSDSPTFVQNAVKLHALIADAEAMGSKTSISFSSILMSVDLPIFPDAIDLDYTDYDAACHLTFDCKAKPVAVATFYTKALEKSGWKGSSKSLKKVNGVERMTFSNAQKDTLTLDAKVADGKTHIDLKYQSAVKPGKPGK